MLSIIEKYFSKLGYWYSVAQVTCSINKDFYLAAKEMRFQPLWRTDAHSYRRYKKNIVLGKTWVNIY